MVKYSPQQLDRIFHALADETRRKILILIAKQQCTVSDLAAPFSMSLPAISKHVKVLEQAGLLDREKSGRIHRCQLNAIPLREAEIIIKELQKYWENKFDALARFLEKTSSTPTISHARRNRK
jgi:DNA-binding transcriptional ArsR family regulator